VQPLRSVCLIPLETSRLRSRKPRHARDFAQGIDHPEGIYALYRDTRRVCRCLRSAPSNAQGRHTLPCGLVQLGRDSRNCASFALSRRRIKRLRAGPASVLPKRGGAQRALLSCVPNHQQGLDALCKCAASIAALARPQTAPARLRSIGRHRGKIMARSMLMAPHWGKRPHPEEQC
jgi:hypothetical protein